MNFVNDSKGMSLCLRYGSSFMVLNKNVRKRCTITNQRKYAEGETVATLKYCYAVLSEFTKKELSLVDYAAQGYSFDSKDISCFKEVHIHGSIYFVQDVECIYAPEE